MGVGVAVHLGEDGERLARRVRRQGADQLWRIVDEDRGAAWPLLRRGAEVLVRDAGAAHLVAEHLLVVGRELLPRGEDRLLRLGALCLAQQPHHRDGVLPRRGRAEPQPRRGVAPVRLKVGLEDLRLGLRGEGGEDGEGGDERAQHLVREAEHEALRPVQRIWHGARQVGEPVHKVKRDVGRVGLARHDDALEAREERVRRRLGLHQPAVVEGHLRLREEHRVALRRVEPGKRGQRLWEVVEHVVHRNVVVVDDVPRREALERRVLRSYAREQRLNLEDVVDRRQREHRTHARHGNLDRTAAPAALREHARVDEKLQQLLPRRVAVEG
mmetsp:Transcript_24726/g.72334  ORF Transcript_24726/g.72334 Transcript_24726/m.72334 type:complete len:328 (+) Transcript_24726:34-1017(+)